MRYVSHRRCNLACIYLYLVQDLHLVRLIPTWYVMFHPGISTPDAWHMHVAINWCWGSGVALEVIQKRVQQLQMKSQELILRIPSLRDY